MTAIVFVDTNILIYAYDANAGVKRSRAVEAIRPLWASGTGRLSVQVLQEFYVNATQKLAAPVALATAREIVRTYTPWVKNVTTPETILRASELADLARISFWDALIVAAAEHSGAMYLYSEDLNAGQMIAGVEIVNPLVAD